MLHSVAQWRSGIVALALVGGRFQNTPKERLWFEWRAKSHFLFNRAKYVDLRAILFHEIASDEQQLEFLFNLSVFKFARFVSEGWKRNTRLFI